MRYAARTAILIAALTAYSTGGCSKPVTSNNLDGRPTLSLSIKGQPFSLWVSDDLDEQSRGLMLVTAEQMSPLPDGTERGMLFAFDHEERHSFWMKDTIIPLDIAYVTTAGRVASMYTMAPLDTRPWQYDSGEPIRYAIEVNADTWHRIGLTVGDAIDIPTSVLKRTP